ncbi:MAG: V-type ATP synthase subunit E family protein [Nitrososphaerales archaeon]
MSKAFENVVNKIVDEVRQEVKVMFEDNLRESLEILEKYKKETIIEAKNIYRSMERQAEIIRIRIVGSAELIIKNKLLELLEKTINEIFQKAFEKIEKMSSSDRYKASMKRLLEEGIEMVASKDLVISCNKKDYAFLKILAEEVANEKKVNIRISEEPIGSVGGIQVRSSDGTIFYDNTVEARVERFKPLLRKDLAKIFMIKE